MGTISNYSKECGHVYIRVPKPMKVKNSGNQIEFYIKEGVFFFFSESPKFFTFNKVIGNFCKCNTSKNISVLYLSDGK